MRHWIFFSGKAAASGLKASQKTGPVEEMKKCPRGLGLAGFIHAVDDIAYQRVTPFLSLRQPEWLPCADAASRLLPGP